MRKSGICAMAAASMAALAMPVAADAKPAKKNYKEATFKATLSGSQVSIWEYYRANNPDDPCDASAQGNGDQTIKFDGKRTFTITFRTPPKNNFNLYSTAGRPAVFTTPFRLNLAATAERNGEFTTNAGEIGDGCGDNGGADPGYVPPQPDCGVRQGRFAARLYFHDATQDEDDLLIPLAPSAKEKDRLTFGTDDAEWLQADSDDQSDSELRNTYSHCPFYGEYPAEAGHIWLSQAKIKESTLFNKRRKRIVISGDHTTTETLHNTKTKTILAWNLRLRRVK